MKRIFLIVSIVLFSYCLCNAKKSKQEAGQFNDYTVSYLLPKTVVDIDVELEFTQEKAGPYTNYSQKYLGVPALVNSDSRRWDVVGISARVSSVPDTVLYKLKLESKASPFISVDDEGVLLAVNKEPVQNDEEAVLVQEKISPSALDDKSYSLSLTEEMLLSGSDIRMAELVAKQIYRLRESRIDIITGDSEQKFDGEALRLMLQQLDEQENRLTVMFLGTKQTQRKVVRVRWIPQTECEDVVVARVSELEGVVDSNNLSGEPILISLRDVIRTSQPLDNKGNVIELPENSVMYNIPGKAQMSITYQGRTLFEKKVELTQFGVKFGLAPKLFVDKNLSTYMVLHPNTGAIQEIGQKPVVE